MSEDCIEDQMGLGDDIDKVVDGIVPTSGNQAENAQSPSAGDMSGNSSNNP